MLKTCLRRIHLDFTVPPPQNPRPPGFSSIFLQRLVLPLGLRDLIPQVESTHFVYPWLSASADNR
jgi:hypothetical protein